MSGVLQNTGSDLTGDRALPAFLPAPLLEKNILSGCLVRARSFSLLPTALHPLPKK